MFDIGGPEIIVILLGIIILFGPKKIPEIAQMLGKGIQKIKTAQSQFKDQINDIQSDMEKSTDTPKTDDEIKVVNPNKLNKSHLEANKNIDIKTDDFSDNKIDNKEVDSTKKKNHTKNVDNES